MRKKNQCEVSKNSGRNSRRGPEGWVGRSSVFTVISQQHTGKKSANQCPTAAKVFTWIFVTKSVEIIACCSSHLLKILISKKKNPESSSNF